MHKAAAGTAHMDAAAGDNLCARVDVTDDKNGALGLYFLTAAQRLVKDNLLRCFRILFSALSRFLCFGSVYRTPNRKLCIFFGLLTTDKPMRMEEFL